MKDELVILATLTFAKAQMLKSVLESAGIRSELINVNVIQPIASDGVKVCVNEEDLAQAMQIMEAGNWLTDGDDGCKPSGILVPVDFSPCSLSACKFAFEYAAKTCSKIYLVHVFFSPIYSSVLPFDNSVGSIEEYNEVLNNVKAKMDALVQTLEDKMKAGELPKVELTFKVLEGIAEDEIIRYSRRKNCSMIVMGSKGLGKNENHLVGSVTAEVMERSSTAVVAIPMAVGNDFGLANINEIAYMTNLDKRDIESFGALDGMAKACGAEVVLLHLISRADDWQKVKLTGLTDFLRNKYPETAIRCKILEDDETLRNMSEYIVGERIDAIAMTRYRRNIFSRLFNPSMSQKVFASMNVPLIVFNK